MSGVAGSQETGTEQTAGAGLEDPQEVRAPDDQRRDGRPTAGHKTGIHPGVAHDEAPTVAPEEEGETPSTEHAPGGDL